MSPDHYKISSPFDPEDSKQIQNKAFAQRRTTFCFGTPRTRITAVQNTKNLPADKQNPGPGTYTDETKVFSVGKRRTTVHARNFYMDATDTAIKRGVPGPGAYDDVLALDGEGKYNSSQMS